MQPLINMYTLTRESLFSVSIKYYKLLNAFMDFKAMVTHNLLFGRISCDNQMKNEKKAEVKQKGLEVKSLSRNFYK